MNFIICSSKIKLTSLGYIHELTYYEEILRLMKRQAVGIYLHESDVKNFLNNINKGTTLQIENANIVLRKKKKSRQN